MAEKKITVAEKFAATIALVRGLEPEIEWSSTDAVEFLEDRAEKAKGKPRAHKAKPETVEFRGAVAEFMAGQAEPMTAKEVGAALGESTQKASAALRFLAGEGVVIAYDGEKARDPKTYEIAR